MATFSATFFKDHDAFPALFKAAKEACQRVRRLKQKNRPKLLEAANQRRYSVLSAFSEYMTERLCRAYPGEYVVYPDVCAVLAIVELAPTAITAEEFMESLTAKLREENGGQLFLGKPAQAAG